MNIYLRILCIHCRIWKSQMIKLFDFSLICFFDWIVVFIFQIVRQISPMFYFLKLVVTVYCNIITFFLLTFLVCVSRDNRLILKKMMVKYLKIKCWNSIRVWSLCRISSIFIKNLKIIFNQSLIDTINPFIN